MGTTIAPPLSAPGHIDRNELALAVERAIARAHAAGTGIESIEAALDSLHEDLGERASPALSSSTGSSGSSLLAATR